MVQITELGPHGLPLGKYGSFAGKEPDSGVPPGPHDPGPITELAPFGLPIGRYGSFAGKEPSVPDDEDDAHGGIPMWWYGGRWVRREKRTEPGRALRDLLADSVAPPPRAERPRVPPRRQFTAPVLGATFSALSLPGETVVPGFPAIALPPLVPKVPLAAMAFEQNRALRMLMLLS